MKTNVWRDFVAVLFFCFIINLKLILNILSKKDNDIKNIVYVILFYSLIRRKKGNSWEQAKMNKTVSSRRVK